jgi:cell division protein FtsW (lipid II flippase)
MDEWIQTVAPQVEAWFAAADTAIGKELLLGVLLLPVLLALFSGRLPTIMACALLALAAACVVVAPQTLTSAALLAGFAGSLLVAVSGLRAKYRERRLDQQLAALRADVDGLVNAESRRLLLQIKANEPRTTEHPAPRINLVS